jgi:putative peptidoglycan binding protein
MRRTLACILVLLMTFATVDAASSKKSRSKGSSSGSHNKRDAGRSRSTRAQSSRDKRGKAVASRGKRGRRDARGHSSRREPQEVSTGTLRSGPGIPPERVTEIQTALIKVGFLDGPATGLYDDATIDAVKQYQAQNGMQQTGLPSAPFLKRLGVSKRSNDGYAVPVNAVSETEKKRPAGEKPQL